MEEAMALVAPHGYTTEVGRCKKQQVGLQLKRTHYKNIRLSRTAIRQFASWTENSLLTSLQLVLQSVTVKMCLFLAQSWSAFH